MCFHSVIYNYTAHRYVVRWTLIVVLVVVALLVLRLGLALTSTLSPAGPAEGRPAPGVACTDHAVCHAGPPVPSVGAADRVTRIGGLTGVAPGTDG